MEEPSILGTAGTALRQEKGPELASQFEHGKRLPYAGLAVRIVSIRPAITVVVEAVAASRPLLLGVRGDTDAVEVVTLIARRSTAHVHQAAADGEAVIACRCTGPTVRARVGRAGVFIITI